MELRFVPMGEMATRIELEHRHFERHDGGAAVAAGVGSPAGWSKALESLRVAIMEKKASR